MSQNRTLPQGMQIQEERQESQSCPDTTQNDDDTHINENGVRQPNPPRVNMLKIIILEPTGDHRENTSNSQSPHTPRDPTSSI